MRDIENLCMNCFSELTEGAVCTECGYDNDTPADTLYLAPKTILEGRYVIGAKQEHESDAVNYAGYDTQLDKQIIIREFYPKGMASRLEGSDAIHIRQRYTNEFNSYKTAFTDLWTTLEKMHKLSAVVPVYDVFEANETVYAIIEYIDSIPLREYLLRNEEGYILWDSARLMFMPVLTTIEALHSNGFIHGSITPDNLVLCRDGKVRLKPFCIQQAADATSELEFNSNDGYSALEQYDNSHKIGPETDIYAFAACIYRALVGSNPPSAPERESNDKLMIPNSIAESIPMHVIKAMGSALQVYPEKRIKDISEFRELLDAAPSVRAQGATVDAAKVKEENQRTLEEQLDYVAHQRELEKMGRKSRYAVIVLVVLIIAAIGAGIYLVKNTDLIVPKEETTTTQLQSFEVPNFSNNGYTQSDIENNGVWNQQFRFTFNGDYSTDVEKGIIFKQSIQPGEKVKEGTEIVLTVSQGIQTVEVPEVGGLSLEDATKKLEAAGLKVSSVEIYNDGTHTKDTVKANDGAAPAVGSTVAVGEEIILQVYGEVQTTTTTTTTEASSSISVN
ncbi:MAG: PASTA domain-containing protein [Eubacterium sp.]|nr:PASTA domain-containing protein [Eubacterium sp.]